MAADQRPVALGWIDGVGLGAAALGAGLFSTKPIFIKLAYADGIDAITLLALRMLLALPFYLAIGTLAFRQSRKISPKLFVAIAANGLLGYYLASLLDFLALQDITAQLERLVLFTYPIFVVLLGALFFGQPFNRWTFPALTLAYSALALVFWGNMDHAGTGNLVRGVCLVLGAAVAFSFFQLFGRELVRVCSSTLYTSIAMTSASLGILAHFAIARPLSDLAVPQDIWVIAFAIAVVATVFPSYLINFALGRIGAGATAMVGNAGPIVTIALSAILLGEPFGILEATGTALVLGAMLLFSRK